MSDLHPCTECGRHVRIDETACPFCAASLEPGVPRRIRKGRFTRAAVFAGALAGATACSSGSKGADDPKPPISDAGVVDQADDDDDDTMDDDDDVDTMDDDDDVDPYLGDDDDDHHPVDMPYGAPPARTRLV